MTFAVTHQAPRHFSERKGRAREPLSPTGTTKAPSGKGVPFRDPPRGPLGRPLVAYERRAMPTIADAVERHALVRETPRQTRK